jgi:hypothetical protein
MVGTEGLNPKTSVTERNLRQEALMAFRLFFLDIGVMETLQLKDAIPTLWLPMWVWHP